MKFVSLLVVLFSAIGLNGQGLLEYQLKKPEKPEKPDLIKTHRPVVESSVRLGSLGRVRLRHDVTAFGKTIILGMSVGDVPTNCVAKVVQTPMLRPKSWEMEGEKRTWQAGDGAVTVAMCVGVYCPPLDPSSHRFQSYEENKDIYRDFTYSTDGRLIRIGEPYIVEPVLKPITNDLPQVSRSIDNAK